MTLTIKQLLALAIVAGAFAFLGAGVAKAEPGSIELQLIAISDWRGQIDPMADVPQGPAGGAAALSAYFAAERSKNASTLTLATGGSFGSSPPLSNLFADEPAAFALRLMGIDFDTLSNENFNHGLDNLRRLLPMTGSRYVSANLTNVAANDLPGVSRFEIVEAGGVRVAIIGLTNQEAPDQVFPGNFGTMDVTDPLIAARVARDDAAKAGADVFVLLAHIGIADVDSAGRPSGPLVELAEQLDGYDVVFGGSTEQQFSGRINGTLVVQNPSQGRGYSRTSLSFDEASSRVTRVASEFVTPLVKDVTPDARVVARMTTYRRELTSRLAQTVATSPAPILRSDACGRADARFCESAVGNTVADAMRSAYGTDFAIANTGAIRADLTCAPAGDSGDFCPAHTPPPYRVTQGQIVAVLPFANVATTVTVSGPELLAMLENAVSMMPAADGRFAQLSGLCFTYDIARAAGSRIASVTRQAPGGSCGGAALDLSAASTYSLTVNDFIAAGGDGYAAVSGRATLREPMSEVLRRFVSQQPSLSSPLQGRIVCVSSGAAPCPAVLLP